MANERLDRFQRERITRAQEDAERRAREAAERALAELTAGGALARVLRAFRNRGGRP